LKDVTTYYDNKENVTSLSLPQCLVSISIFLSVKRLVTIAIFTSALL
jgi:hypothetical protein